MMIFASALGVVVSVAWLETINMGLWVLSFLVAVLLVVFSRRELYALLLAGWVTFGSLWLAGLALGPVWFGWGVQEASVYSLVLAPVTMGFIVSFSLVYPEASLTPARKRGLLSVVVVGSGLLLFVALRPGFLVSSEGLTGLGNVALWGTMGAGYLVGLLLLAWRWLTSPSGAYRLQVLWALIPLLFLNVHDTLGRWVLPAVAGPRHGFDWWLDVWLFPGVALALLGLGVALGLCLWAIARAVRGVASRDERTLALLAPYLFAVSFLQVYDLYTVGSEGPLHWLLDYLAIAFIVYGVFRHNVVDLDLKFKRGIKHSTVVASFVAVFFVVSEGAKVIFAGFAGNELLGVLAAGVLVFFIAPLQRIGEAVSKRVVPVGGQEDSYLAYRRVQIYKVALEGALRDGTVDTSERKALENLREELGLSMADHERLEAEVRQRLVKDERLERGVNR